MKEDRLLWIVNIICSIVFGTVLLFPKEFSESFSVFANCASGSKFVWIVIHSVSSVRWNWTNITVVTHPPKNTLFRTSRMKILRYSLKKSIVRGHVLKMNYLHDSDIGFLSLLVCFCPRMIKWSTFPWWSSIIFFDRTF